MSDDFLDNARRGTRIAWRAIRREIEGLPFSRLLCAMNLHSRSKRQAFKVGGVWQTECRRCKCAMARDENGDWHKK